MALPFFGKKKAEPKKESVKAIGVYAPPNVNSLITSEQFKGEVEQDIIKFPQELGEAHPFDFSMTEGLYMKVGIITGVIDKYVDFVVGPGFFIKTDDDRAKAIIEDFMRDTQFDTLLRGWIKEALIKGTGFLELGGSKNEPVNGMKVLDSKFMFIDRNDKGEIEGYNQFRGAMNHFRKNKVIHFQPFQIAQIGFNKTGDMAYGLGIIYPGINNIDNLLGSEKDMHLVLSRKANSPIHAKIGNDENPVIPSAVDDFGKKLEWLNNKHEWATDHLVDMKVIDFPNVGDKFENVIRHDLDMLFFTFQVPEVLMGRGNIPEGLAKVQLEAFERRIQSIQAEVEKVIEQQIFRRVLNAQGFNNHVEFEWGQPSNTEKNERIDRITKILELFTINPLLRTQLELELAQLLGINEALIVEPEAEREAEEEEPQPVVPGQNREEFYDILDSSEYHPDGSNVTDILSSEHSGEQDSDMSLREWLDFNYIEFLDFIRSALRSENFDFLKATTSEELRAGRFSDIQVNELKEVLQDGFNNGSSMRTIASNINERVRPKDLLQMEDGKIKLKEDGTPALRVSSQLRGINLARSETTRVAATGAKLNYKSAGIQEVQWVAAIGSRTCPICIDLNGQIFSIDSNTQPPAHNYCRCTLIPIVEG